MARKAQNGNAAVLYIRVSTADQAEHGVSLDAQAERLMAYAKAAGLSVTAVLREEGVSGTVPLADRPEGSTLARMIEAGEVRHVVALKLDRLFRSAVDALRTTEEWDRKGVAVHLVDMGGQSLNTGSAMGRMMLTMLAGFAQFERDLTAERTVAALAHKRSSGEVYSPVPFGKTRTGDRLEENAVEAGIIERIRSWRGEGLSLRSIVSRLDAEGIPTKKGGSWHASTVGYILAHAA
jgi:DNA invertase Pin-like site-specific DNA recombinase